MRINHVRIENVLGLELVELDAGQMNLIEGENGKGKSSILKAISGALGGGNQAELIRQGADKGEVVLLLDTGHELTARFGQNGTTRKIKTPDDAVITAAQTWIEKRLNPSSFNPISFLNADDDAQVKMLLKTANLRLPWSALAKACEGTGLKTPECIGELVPNPLESIDALAKTYYDKRTGINRSAKDKRSSAAELSKSLPPEATAPVANLAELEAEKKAIGERAKTEKTANESKLAAVKTEANAIAERNIKEAESHRDAEIRDAERVRDQAIELARRTCEARCSDRRLGCEMTVKQTQSAKDAKIEEANQAAATEAQAIQDRHGPRFAELNGLIGSARAKAEENARADNTRLIVAKTIEEAVTLEKESKALTTTLERLDLLKGKLIEKLPVPGLEIKEGRLVYEGIPLKTLNDEKRIDIALHLAIESAGEMKVVFVDGFEKVSTKNQKRIFAWAEKTDCQLFVSRVVDDLPLTVNGEVVSTELEEAEEPEEVLA